MPIPIPLIALGAGVAETGFNAIMQGATNKKNRNFSREMYMRQRGDALADWEMNNAYNSPAAQMQRFKDAGLNPNLIYGQTNTAQPVRSSNAPNAPAQAPSVDLSSPLMSYADIRMKDQQMDILKANEELLLMEKLVKSTNIQKTLADIEAKNVGTARGKFELGLRESNSQALGEIIQQTLQKLKADTAYTLDQNERATAMQASNLKEAAERILTMKLARAKTNEEISEIKHRINNIDSDSLLKTADLRLREKGIYPGDPIWMRALVQWLETGKFDLFEGKTMKLFGAEDPNKTPSAVERIKQWRAKRDSTNWLNQ